MDGDNERQGSPLFKLRYTHLFQIDVIWNICEVLLIAILLSSFMEDDM